MEDMFKRLERKGEYEMGDGRCKLSLDLPQLPLQDYLKVQGRFRHLSMETVKEIQHRVDKEYTKLMGEYDEHRG